MDSRLSPIYVIGHVNPDTDAIAAAMGYAWLLRERDGVNAVAARAGAPNRQTAWVLQTVGLEPPLLITDASPRFERIARPLPPILPTRPLREAWEVAAASRAAAPIVSAEGQPLGLVTSLSVFRFLSSKMGEWLDLENVSVARLLAVPAQEAMTTEVPRFMASMRLRDARPRVLREELDDFFITHEDGSYKGICRSPEILNPPRLQLVLVDHNEPGQAVTALDEADVLEVLDHHRLGNLPTRAPIPFSVETVGSTSTLVTERIMQAGLKPPVGLAGLLLAGLLSDTLILRSPTTTDRDKRAADRLSVWCLGSAPQALPFESFSAYGEAILSAGAGLAVRSIESILGADLKVYEEAGHKFSVAQVEVANLMELNERLPEITAGMNDLCHTRGFQFAVLMVTDVVRGTSRLVVGGDTDLLTELPYRTLPDGTLDAPGIVSRKKQLLPALLSLFK